MSAETGRPRSLAAGLERLAAVVTAPSPDVTAAEEPGRDQRTPWAAWIRGRDGIPDDRSNSAAIPAGAWLRSIHDAVGPSGGAALTDEEQAALLDLAPSAGHSSERITAPLTTFLAGVAYGSLPADDRAKALRALVSRLER